MSKCGYVIPSFSNLNDKDIGVHECLLSAGHDGEHLCRLEDGQYVLWCPMDELCETCTPGYCECFDYEELSESEAMSRFGILK